MWDVGTNAPERGVTSFYWLGREDGLNTGVIVVNLDRDANRVTVESCTAEQGTLKIYLTAAMESGKAWYPTVSALPRYSGSFGLLGETTFGVVYFGAGIGDRGDRRMFFRLGRVF